MTQSLSKYGAQDVMWFVIAKDKTGMIGYEEFLIKPEYPWGTIKASNCHILPSAQRRGLGKLFLSSLFKLLPQSSIKRILIRSLEVNTQAIAACTSYGFRQYDDQDKHALPISWSSYCAFFEYQPDECALLQNESHKLQPIG